MKTKTSQHRTALELSRLGRVSCRVMMRQSGDDLPVVGLVNACFARGIHAGLAVCLPTHLRATGWGLFQAGVFVSGVGIDACMKAELDLRTAITYASGFRLRGPIFLAILPETKGQDLPEALIAMLLARLCFISTTVFQKGSVDASDALTKRLLSITPRCSQQAKSHAKLLQTVIVFFEKNVTQK